MAHFDTSGLEDAAAELVTQGIDVVRVGYSDLIGTERGRDVLVNRFARTVEDGVAFCRSVYGTTPMGDVVDIEGGWRLGCPTCLPSPTSARFTWCRGSPASRTSSPMSTTRMARLRRSPRMVLKRVIQQFAELGMRPIAGPELGSTFWSAPTRTDRWQRYGEATGNVYVAGLKGDPENVLLRTLRHLSAYGLEVVAANHEFSSGQFEINLWHSEALDAADRAFRFKSAIQELARQDDKLATFMAKPFNDEGGSGFHIHFSTWDDAGQPLFDDPKTNDGLSRIAKSAIAGVLAHAPALAAVSNPTINSYKRFGPDTSLHG